MIKPPPKLSDLRYGTKLVAGMGFSTVIADLDFETFNEAGFVWDPYLARWKALPHAAQGKKGLPVVGAAAYLEHPTAEILCGAYDLKDGLGRRPWLPMTDLFPDDLYIHILEGRLIEAWNAGFERHVWETIGVPKLGWPPIARRQWRCAMAKSRAHALPGKLEKAGEVLNTDVQKDKDGTRLLNKFSIPRNPTKTDPRVRIRPQDDPADAALLYSYNLTDIAAEAEISSLVPDLEGEELEYWFADQEINCRGVQIDLESVKACASIVEQALDRYNAELFDLTCGTVEAASQLQRLVGWLGAQGVHVTSLDEEHVGEVLQLEMPPNARRAVEIRALVGSASVKKLFAMLNQVCADGRLRDLFMYCGARTSRATGSGPQPTNLPNSGPEILRCGCCGKHYGTHLSSCPWCASDGTHAHKDEWGSKSTRCVGCGIYHSHSAPHCPDCDVVSDGVEAFWSIEDVITVARTGSLDCMEMFFGEALPAISGCLRGMFVSKPGYDLICSDYSAIEAVVLAELAGEKWRQDVFRTHGKIYEASASKLTGIPLEEILSYKKLHGTHHPSRKKGKIAELALGYGGWIGALIAFGADEFMTEQEMSDAAGAWRRASPAIVEFWGGQQRNWRPELFGIEGAAIAAVQNPGQEFSCRGHVLQMRGDTLYLRVLSGGYLTYHRPRLAPSSRRAGDLTLSFEGWNTNPKNGPPGWIRIETYGPKIVENCMAEGTLVLTDGGWKPIERVLLSDLVYDGVDFVTHGGSILKSEQTCLSVDGVWMTPDHRVLVEATSNEAQRIYRPEVRDKSNDPLLPNQSWVAAGQIVYFPEAQQQIFRVYDLLNCGPKERFTVLGGNGPLVVHNCVQKTARDLQRYAIINQEKAGYGIVLHVYDENVAEIPEGWGSLEEFERIMSTVPPWAAGWPVRAAGGWRGKRYQKG